MACPPLNLYPLGWFGLVPLLWALEREPRSGFGTGATAGVVFNGGTVYWLAFNVGTTLPLALLTAVAAAAVLTLGWGMAAWLFGATRRRLGFVAYAAVPFGWTAWEGLLGHLGELAFPWPILALTQAGHYGVLQVMEYTGVWGVSWWVAAVNTLLFLLILPAARVGRRYFLAMAAALALVPVGAAILAERWRADTLRYPPAAVMAVQGNISPLEKWVREMQLSWVAYDSLTHLVARDGQVELVVWPETAMPAHVAHSEVHMRLLTGLSDATGAAILTGTSDYRRVHGKTQPLNAVVLAKPGQGIVQRGAKVHLVPFGERVPFQRWFPGLGKLNLGQAEFLPAASHTLFEAATGSGATIRTPVLVCYESIFPELSRQMVRAGANLLTVVSNDAWYGRSSEPAQIAALSRFRCIENRRAMVRAANTGISFISDHLGREVGRTRLFEPGWVAASVQLVDRMTFYTRHGDWLLTASTAVYGAALAAAAWRRSRA